MFLKPQNRYCNFSTSSFLYNSSVNSGQELINGNRNLQKLSHTLPSFLLLHYKAIKNMESYSILAVGYLFIFKINNNRKKYVFLSLSLKFKPKTS